MLILFTKSKVLFLRMGNGTNGKLKNLRVFALSQMKSPMNNAITQRFEVWIPLIRFEDNNS
jgi:predicted nuclease of predicted toxin-antitoxin system